MARQRLGWCWILLALATAIAQGDVAHNVLHVDRPIAEEVANEVTSLRAQSLGQTSKALDHDRVLRDLDRLRQRTQARLAVLDREWQTIEQRVATLPEDAAAAKDADAVTPRQSASDRLEMLRQLVQDNQRNAADIEDLSAEMSERKVQARLDHDLTATAEKLTGSNLNVDEVNRLLVTVAGYRAAVKARVAQIEGDLQQARDSLWTLLPEAEPTKADAKTEVKTDPVKIDPAAATDKPLAANGDGETEDRLAAALAGQSASVVAEAQRLSAQAERLRRWQGEYRLLLLRADEVQRTLAQQLQERATAELLQRGDSLVVVAHRFAVDPSQWVGFVTRLIEGSVVPTLGRRPLLFMALALLLTVCALVGRWVRTQVRRAAERLQPVAFGQRLWQSLLAVLAHHAPWAFVLGGTATFIATVGAPSDRTPFLALLCYALLLFILMRMINRTLLAPFPPATSFTPLPRQLEYTIARRLTMLMLVGVLGYLLFRILGEYALPADPFLLLRAGFVGMLAINLGWLLWVVGHLPGVKRYSSGLRMVIVALLMFGLGAEFAGYRNLAQYLLRGVVGTVLSAPALWITRQLLDELLDSLRTGRAAWSRRLRAMLDVEPGEPVPGVAWLRFGGGLLYWVGSALVLLRVWATNTGYEGAVAILDKGFKLGSLQMVPSRLVNAVLVLSLLQTAAAWVPAFLRRALRANQRMDGGAKDALVTIVGYVGYGLAVLAMLSMLNINFAALAVVAGALSVGIGFGMQNLVSNFVSGLVLLFERPVRVGDLIEVDGYVGTVTKVSVRSTEIATLDATEVIVPNAELIAKPLVNRTRHTTYGRIKIPVSVAYGTELEPVLALLGDIARSDERVLQTPNQAPVVLFTAFADSGLEIELRCVVENVRDAHVVRSELMQRVERALREHGVEIPYPRIDLAVRGGLEGVTVSAPDAQSPPASPPD